MPRRASRFLSLALSLLFVLCSLASATANAVEDPTTPGDGPIVAPIVGGKPASTQPWMVALVRTTTRTGLAPANLQACGGVLIDPHWVLTAAHCIDTGGPDSLQAIVGRGDLNGSGGEILDIAEFVPHPRYGKEFTYDIGLVRLRTPSSATPIALADAALIAELRGGPMTIYGWGYQGYRSKYECKLDLGAAHAGPDDFRCDVFISSRGPKPGKLSQGPVRIHGHAECERRFREYRVANDLYVGDTPFFGADVTPDILCVWDDREVYSVCYGDSGGPLVTRRDGEPFVLGVASYIVLSECTSRDQIAAYTSVAYFGDFIAGTLARRPELGFAELCPARPALGISTRTRDDGGIDVSLSWAGDPRTTAYRLLYAASTGDRGIGRLELGSEARAFTTVLASGQDYRVTLQAMGEACDSPMSAPVRVAAP